MQTLPSHFSKSELDVTKILQKFASRAPYVGVRWIEEHVQERTFMNEKSERLEVALDRGVQFEVAIDGALGYAGTSNLTDNGLNLAFDRACALTRTIAPHRVLDFDAGLRPASRGEYRTTTQREWAAMTRQGLVKILLECSEAMKVCPEVATRVVSAQLKQVHSHFVNSLGADFRHEHWFWVLSATAIARQGHETQQRTLNGGLALSYQGGIEIIDRLNLIEGCKQIALEAGQLLRSPDCPRENTDLILAPDQMMLQIHESIGHPLELDRILGDERNYAGWSFVKKEDFGRLQYGSNLMNVTFDPTEENEFASYGFDDCGNVAKKETLIEKGLLVRGLGSLESQKRLGVPGVANFRAASWNRAPIDRMANINLEPGTATLASLIASVERGILMRANRSWSIDDYRNKFQFGCEWGERIENGKIIGVVKNPNYRGITVDFWNRLAGLSGPQEVAAFGTPFCGKGEPNQVIRVGHKSPYCLFKAIDVFGGGAH